MGFGGPQDDMGMMPPEEDFGGNAFDPNTGGGMQDPGMGGGESVFDTNFDAGVEADEETDPKKYIQQLTGKLSQTLRKYNSELPQPDVDLNKYVSGMILKQSTEGLSEQDAEEIIDKVKSGEDFQPTDDGQMPQQQGPDMNDGGMPPQQGPDMMGGGMPPQQGPDMMGGQMPPQQMESRFRRGRRINEMTIEPRDEDHGTDDFREKRTLGKSYRKSPFVSPRMN